MLDGLDEVADSAQRQAVVTWVEKQMGIHNENRFILTSRPHGYQDNPLSGVTVLTVRPFTPAQVQRFINNWYWANEVMSQQKEDEGVKMAAQEGVELYTEICDVFLGKRQQAKGVTLDLTPTQRKGILQPLAYHMMVEQIREIGIEEALTVIKEPLHRAAPQIDGAVFLKQIEQESGLLLERERGEYSFAHLTFQEYLASAFIKEHGDVATLAIKVDEGWWNECIRLYVAQADATPLLQACLAGDPPSIARLTLAMECAEEAKEIQPALREQLDQVMDEWVEVDDPEKRRTVAEALLTRRLRQFVPISKTTHMDKELISQAEYQLFIDEMRANGKHYQPDHWETTRFVAGTGKMPVVGVRHKDALAFCEWLTGRGVGDWVYRLPTPNEPILEHAFVGYWVKRKQGFYCQFTGQKPQVARKTLSQYIRVDLARALDHSLDRALSLYRDISHSHSLSLDLSFDFSRDLNHARALPFALLKRMRIFNLIVASTFEHVALQAQDKLSMLQRLWRNNQQKEAINQLNTIAARYMDLYIQFVILEERRAGRLAAFEGIRLVRERKQE